MRPLGLEQRVRLYAMLAGLPASVAMLIVVWTASMAPSTRWALTALFACVWVGFAIASGGLVTFPLRTLSNVLAAIGEGDYSIRARAARSDDSLGEVFRELNALVDSLHSQRLGAMEATALLQNVVDEIDVAVFSFDDSRRLRLANPAAERLLALPRERMLGASAADLDLADCLEGDSPRIISKTFRKGRPLGIAPGRLSPGWLASSAARHFRYQPSPPRGGTPDLASPHSGPRP